MVGLSRSITLSFMVVGHTKFAPDAGFGLIKKNIKKQTSNACKTLLKWSTILQLSMKQDLSEHKMNRH